MLHACIMLHVACCIFRLRQVWCCALQEETLKAQEANTAAPRAPVSLIAVGQPGSACALPCTRTSDRAVEWKGSARLTRCPHLRRDWARPLPTSAPGLGSPLPHLRRGWARPCHICAGTGLAPATSAPGLGSPLPHLRRDRARPATFDDRVTRSVIGTPCFRNVEMLLPHCSLAATALVSVADVRELQDVPLQIGKSSMGVWHWPVAGRKRQLEFRCSSGRW